MINTATSASVPDKIEKPDFSSFSAIDSLNKFLATDSFVYNTNHPFYVGRANKNDFGIFQMNDTNSIVYQKINNTWNVTDTFKNSLTNVTTTDLNGDGYKDLKIICYVTASGANSENVVFIFNPKNGRFTHNGYFDLPNIKYDKTRRTILAAWWSSASRPQEKMTYKIVGDSLIFDKGVTYSVIKKNNEDIGSLEFYTEQNNKRVTKDKVEGSPDKIWTMFSKALWDSSND